MKVGILNILILSCCIYLVQLKPREAFKKTFRYFKISCSSTNKTCNKPFCYLKNTRNDSKFSAGCDVIKKVNKFYVSKVIKQECLKHQSIDYSYRQPSAIVFCRCNNSVKFSNSLSWKCAPL